MRTLTATTRERIFDAAAQLFAVQRFHEVRMEDVADAAEVGKGTLYRYFHDKEDLYYALIEAASRQLSTEVDRRLAHAASVVDKLEQVVAAIISFFDSQPYFFDLIQHVEALQTPGRTFPWSRTRKEFLARVTRLFEQGTTRGEFAVSDPVRCALMLLGSVRAVIRFGERPRPPRLARQIAETILFGASRIRTQPTRRAKRRSRLAVGSRNGKPR